MDCGTRGISSVAAVESGISGLRSDDWLLASNCCGTGVITRYHVGTLIGLRELYNTEKIPVGIQNNKV
jgi:hypothetical protein